STRGHRQRCRRAHALPSNRSRASSVLRRLPRPLPPRTRRRPFESLLAPSLSTSAEAADVLLQGSSLAGGPSAVSDEPYGIDIEKERGRAALRARFGVKDVRCSVGKGEGPRSRGVLVEQITQVRRGS